MKRCYQVQTSVGLAALSAESPWPLSKIAQLLSHLASNELLTCTACLEPLLYFARLATDGVKRLSICCSRLIEGPALP